MKSISLFAAVLFSFACFSQQTINGSLEVDGNTREYILYIPEAYDGSESYPLVFNFHGYTSNAFAQMWYGDFRPIADTAKFMVVHPEGLPDNLGIQHFNVGWGGSTVDDVGFIDALLDHLIGTYNISAERVYSTGMSNGGFMSYHLACQLPARFAAVASVTGSMTPFTDLNCTALPPMPIMEIHGTSDDVVAYEGSNIALPIDEVVANWVEFNNCNPQPSFSELPNIAPNDGSTVEHYVYSNGTSGASVELFKIIDGGHTWPGALGIGDNEDIDAAAEIWRFFSQYDTAGEITSLEESHMVAWSVFPNPANDVLSIHLNEPEGALIRLYDSSGRLVKTEPVLMNQVQIDIRKLDAGMYFIHWNGQTQSFVKSR